MVCFIQSPSPEKVIVAYEIFVNIFIIGNRMVSTAKKGKIQKKHKLN